MMVLCSAYGCNNRSDRKEKVESESEVGASNNKLISNGPNESASGIAMGCVGEDSHCHGPQPESLELRRAQRKQLLTEKLSFHKFPKSGLLRDQWIGNWNRERQYFHKHYKLCSIHFEPDCFEESYWQNVQRGEKVKRQLLPTAVPTLFVRPTPTAQPKARVHTEARLNKKRRLEEVAEVLETYNEPSESENTPPMDAVHDDESVPGTLDSNSRNVQTQTTKEKKCAKPKMVNVGIWTHVETRSIGIQCGLVNPTEAETQTVKEDQFIFNVFGSPSKIIHDHKYSTEMEQGNTHEVNKEPIVMDDEQEPHDEEFSDEQPTDLDDPDWEPGESDQEVEVEVVEHVVTTSSAVSELKFLIFESSLNQLLKHCPRCGAPVLEKDTVRTGSLLTVNLHCSNFHSEKWLSQPVCGRYAMGNILLSAACLFAGATYTRIHQIATFLGLAVHCPKTFFDHQSDILFPVIAGAWKLEKANVIKELSQREKVVLVGDGRCDSPGYCAKYGTYTLMDSETSKIAEFEVVQVSSSVAMEKEGLKRTLEKIDNAVPPVKISTLATDRHIQIGKYMATDRPGISHQYDIWHFAKNITSRLNERAKTKKHAILRPWIQCITNHLWWSAATCGGSEQSLRERWISVIHHVTGQHEWDTGTVYHRCEHEALSDEDSRGKLWMKPGSPTHKLLQDIVFDPKLLKAMGQLTEFCHTGALEVAHSLYLKYCPKRQHFTYEGMVARTMLAALDNNNNTGRAQATIKSGENVGEKRYKYVYPKGRKRWVAKPILEEKNYQYVTDMLHRVEDLCQKRPSPEALGSIHVPQLPPNISRNPRPSKEEVVSTQKSRLHKF